MEEALLAIFSFFISQESAAPPCEARVLAGRHVMSLEDPRFHLWGELEESIQIANDIIGDRGELQIVPIWKQKETRDLRDDLQRVAVYVLESPGGLAGNIAFKQSVDSAVRAVEEQWDNIYLNETNDGCSDLDDCIEELYDPLTTQTFGRIIERVHALDPARADASCPVVIFNHLDLDAYNTMLNIKGEDGSGIHLPYLLVPVLLHEVGHHVEFEVDETRGWYNSFLTAASRTTPSQLVELRADAYAAATIADGCDPAIRSYSFDRKEVCMSIVAQWYLYYRHMLFDRSRGGRCRMFLPQSPTHPNILRRVLLQGAILSSRFGVGSANFFEAELARHDNIRDGLLEKPWIESTLGCRRAEYFGEPER